MKNYNKQDKNKKRMQEYKSKYSKQNKEKIKKQNAKWYQQNKEHVKENGKKWNNNNKEYKNKRDKEYRKCHKEQLAAYYHDNKTRISAKNTEYYHKNKDKIRIRNRKYKAQRMKDEPTYKLKENLSHLINEALKRNKGNKNNQSSFKYLDYTVQELYEHIEGNFTSDMNWENHGVVWNIDHYIPCNLFDYKSMNEQQFRVCWALDNLYPLNAHINKHIKRGTVPSHNYDDKKQKGW